MSDCKCPICRCGWTVTLPPGFEADLLKAGGRVMYLRSEPEGGLFPLGRIAVTTGAAYALAGSEERSWDYLARHVKGDCGIPGRVAGDEDANENPATPREGKPDQVAVENGCSRVVSEYWTEGGAEIWVLTEPGEHPRTTVMLPGEY